LEVALADPRNRNAVVVPKLDYRFPMNVRRDEGCQLLHRLSVGEVVEFDGIHLRIEVDDGVGAKRKSAIWFIAPTLFKPE
jgi:hypothetical protein